MPSTLQQGAVFRNPFSLEIFTFSASPDDPQIARFDITLELGGAGGANAIEHFHPEADERFAVKSRRLKVVLDGTEILIGLGEQIVVPHGRTHFFVNAHEGTTEITVELRPAQQHVRFFANLASLAQNHPEWFSDQGVRISFWQPSCCTAIAIISTAFGYRNLCRSSCSRCSLPWPA